ncbi:MAG: hypothetical protein M3165_03685 [Actinomycetota bacterium]|nr:hypothetical protein [Actinomycetota bacterium]
MGSLRGLLAGRHASPPLSLDAVLAALGDDGVDSRRRADVPLADVVGTLNRVGDFDQDFRLTNPALRSRWKDLALAMEAGLDPPPVELIQVGDLYFVVDGHHRVSVARALGRDTVAARVLRLCTVAYGMCSLRAPHLEVKAAERRFLQRVPLDVGVRCTLWLDCAGDWLRLADAAEAWGFRRALRGGAVPDRCELARAWWTEEVMPVVAATRAAGLGAGLRDVRVYLDALTAGATHAAEVRA